MVFADVGDHLSIEGADSPEFALAGPMADGLDDCVLSDNLVVRARDLLLSRIRRPLPPFRLVLTKNLPTAAGVGGGSSDAGAALRLVRGALELPVSDDQLERLAGELGSDGPACFRAEPVLGTGWGDVLSAAPQLPRLDAVLVNPRRPCSTGAVYRAFDALSDRPDASPPPMPERLESAEEAAAWLAYCRNDLEAPAISVCPDIAEVLDVLRGEPETLLARLSGSGATAFALCSGDIEAEGLVERLQLIRPDWWVQRCQLGGPWER
jgi:4-diphosphocytidyl-2-C-methyl-D-erythritol kinase